MAIQPYIFVSDDVSQGISSVKDLRHTFDQDSDSVRSALFYLIERQVPRMKAL